MPLAVLAGMCSAIGIGVDIWGYPLDRLSAFYLYYNYVESIFYSVETGKSRSLVYLFRRWRVSVSF